MSTLTLTINLANGLEISDAWDLLEGSLPSLKKARNVKLDTSIRFLDGGSKLSVKYEPNE